MGRNIRNKTDISIKSENMDVTLSLANGTEHVLENAEAHSYRKIEDLGFRNSIGIEPIAVGKPMTVVFHDVPDNLRKALMDMIEVYCNIK